MRQTLSDAGQRRELLSGLGVVLGGLVLLLSSFAIATPVRTSPGLGPQALPALVSAGIIACGLLLTLSAVRGKDPNQGIEEQILGEAESADLEELLHEAPEPIPWGNLGVVLVLLVLYAATFIPLGFILSTTAFLFAMTTYIHPAKWLRNLLFAVLLSVSVFFLFRDALSVSLPVGLLG